MAARSVHVVAKVLSVHRNVSFPCCVSCSRRLRTLHDENVFFCSYCGHDYDKKSLIFRYRVNITVSDRSQISNVTIFGQCLEMFFGTSATHFNRFIERSLGESEDLPIPLEQLVQQCIEQCFIGTMVRLTFRGLNINESSTDSQPNLRTIEANTAQNKQTSNLLASHISRIEDFDNGVTVFEILKDNLKSLRQRVSSPHNSKRRSSSSQDSVISQGTNTLLSYESSRQSFYSKGSFCSQLVLSCETPSSTSESTVSSKMTTKDISKSSMCYSPIYDVTQNRTALLLLSLQGTDSPSLSSNNFINDTSPGHIPTEPLDAPSEEEDFYSSYLLGNHNDKTSQDFTGNWKQKSFIKMDMSDVDCVDSCGDLSADLANMSINQSYFDKECTMEYEAGLNQVDNTADCPAKSVKVKNSTLDVLTEPKVNGLCCSNQKQQGSESLNDSFDQYLMLCEDDMSDSLLQEACEAVKNVETVGPSEDASNIKSLSTRGEMTKTREFEGQQDTSMKTSMFVDQHQRTDSPNLFDDSCSINPAIHKTFANQSTPLNLEYKRFSHYKDKSHITNIVSPLRINKLNEPNCIAFQRDGNLPGDKYWNDSCLTQGCSQSPLLFSFSSEYDSLREEMHGSVQKADIPSTPMTDLQDSLLTSSLLECSYLR